MSISGKSFALFDSDYEEHRTYDYPRPQVKFKKNQPVQVNISMSIFEEGGGPSDSDLVEIQLGCGVEEVQINGVILRLTDSYPSGTHEDIDNAPSSPPEAVWGKPVGGGWEASLKGAGCQPILSIYTTLAKLYQDPDGGTKSFSVTVLDPSAPSSCEKEDPGGMDVSENGDGGFQDEYDPGEGDNGVWPGGVKWRAATLAEGVSLNSLTFPGGILGLPGVWSNRNSTRFQVKTQTALLDAQTSANQMVVKVFPASQIGPLASGFHDQTGKTPTSTTTYLLSGGKLEILRTDSQENPVAAYTLEHDTVSGKRTWTDEITGVRKASTFVETAGANPGDLEREITHEEWHRLPASTTYELISRTKSTYINDWRGLTHTPAWFLVESVNDPGGANITTQTWYDEETAQWSVQRNSDGSWVSRSRWSANGPIGADGLPDLHWPSDVESVTYRPWLDSTLPSSGVPDPNTCVAELDVSLSGGIQRRETRVMGQMTRRVDTWSENLQEGGSGPFYNVEFTRTWNSGAAGDYLDSSTWTHTEGDWEGRTYKTVEEDGSVRRFAYEEFTYSNAGFTGECIQTTEWQEGSGLRSKRIVDEDDRLREEREEVLSSGALWEVLTSVHYSYEIDSAGRLQSESRFRNGILFGKTTYISSTETLEESMGSPAIRTITDGDGNVLSVTEDYPAGTPDIVTTYTRAGRTETVTRSAGDLSESSVTVLDVAGRITSSTDAQGITTTTAYDVTNRTVTVTRPGGVTEVVHTYVDGRQKSRSGTGVIPSFTAYSVDADGFIATTEHTGSSDNSSPRTVTTLSDWSGRTHSVSRPSPSGSGTVVQNYHYDAATGRLMRISNNAGIAAQVYAYDSMGRVTLSGLDLNGDGLATVLSGDRLTERTVTYDKGFGLWWEATTTKQYYENNSDSAYTRVERRRMKPDLVGGAARWTSVVIEPDGPEVTSHRDETLADGTVTETVDSNATTVSPDSLTVMIAGRLQSSSEYGSSPGSSYTYDALGRMIAMTDARGGTTRTFYNGLGQVEKTTDHAQNPTTYEYYPANHASAGLVKKVTNGEQQTTEYTYNSLGRVQTVGGSGSYPQAYGYSAYGELNTLTTYPAGGSGETTTWVHDPATGVLKEKIYPGGKKTTYAYHAHGKPSRRTWARTAGGAVFSDYAYTLAGDLEGIDYSDATPDVSIVPDRLGRPTTVTDGGGEQTIAYEAAGEADVTYSATHAALPGVTLDRTWDHATGRRTDSGVYRGGTWDQKSVYGYDAASGRLGSVTGGSNGSAVHEYSYDPGTNVIKGIEHRVNSSLEAEQKRRIDPAGRLYGMETLNGSGTVRQRHGYKYDKAGRRTKLTREDGAWWDYGYNDRGEVISGKKKLPGGTPLAGHQFEYAYDAIGNRDWAKSGGDTDGQNLRTTDYAANGLNQYTQITTTGKFDILGRSPAAIVTVNGTAALRQGERFRSEVTAINVGSAVWKAVTVDDGTSPAVTGNYYLPKLSVQPQYDDDGNLTADGRWLYEWDAENRLVVMKTDTATQQSGQPYVRLVFSYDWIGRRVRKQVFGTPTGTTPVEDRRFAYDGWNLVAEYTASGSSLTLQRSYVWGTDLSGTEQGAGGVGGLLSVHVANGNPVGIPAYDGNGNITGWLDSSGTLLSQMEYDPFGNRIVDEGEWVDFPIGFSTKYQDKETGLYYYGYRYYQPVHGRWINRDPIRENGGYNLYGISENDPINMIDILGLKPFSVVLRTYVEHSYFKESYWASRTLGRGAYNVKELVETAMASVRVSGECQGGVISISSVIMRVRYPGGSELDGGVGFNINYLDPGLSIDEARTISFGSKESYSSKRYLDVNVGTSGAVLKNGDLHILLYGSAVYNKPVPTTPGWVKMTLKSVPVFGTAFGGLAAGVDSLRGLGGHGNEYRSKGAFGSKLQFCCEDETLVERVKNLLKKDGGDMKIINSFTK